MCAFFKTTIVVLVKVVLRKLNASRSAIQCQGPRLNHVNGRCEASTQNFSKFLAKTIAPPTLVHLGLSITTISNRQRHSTIDKHLDRHHGRLSCDPAHAQVHQKPSPRPQADGRVSRPTIHTSVKFITTCKFDLCSARIGTNGIKQ